MRAGRRPHPAAAGSWPNPGVTRPGNGSLTMRDVVLPLHRLPPGYESAFRNPPDPPVTPRPAATLALLRQGPQQLEILLLKRSPRARFIPGAYVFPGGRVDREDESAELAEYFLGAEPFETEAPYGTSGGRLHSAGGSPPPLAFVAAALRETLEETGILVAGEAGGTGPFSLNTHPLGDGILPALRAGKMSFREALEQLERPPLPGNLTGVGHWVTPVQERYRYDTLFFAARVPPDCTAVPDGQELVEGLWVTPEEALVRNREGNLPMVFPTLHTLEALLPYTRPEEALEELGKRNIPRLLPTVEETGDGIRMVL